LPVKEKPHNSLASGNLSRSLLHPEIIPILNPKSHHTACLLIFCNAQATYSSDIAFHISEEMAMWRQIWGRIEIMGFAEAR
jgi:hypothetical protein